MPAEAVFSALYAEEAPALRREIVEALPDVDPADLLHDVFALLWARLRVGRPLLDPAAWLWAVAADVVSAQTRRDGRQAVAELVAA